jgi:hypothetical protein
MFDVGQKVICVRKGGWKRVSLADWPGKPGRGPGRENWFDAKCFRPKEPSIEALRNLITELPVKQPEEV